MYYIYIYIYYIIYIYTIYYILYIYICVCVCGRYLNNSKYSKSFSNKRYSPFLLLHCAIVQD